MMSSAHNRYNLLLGKPTKHKHTLLCIIIVQELLTIQMGSLQRIHHQYIRYESALDDTLIGIENLNSGYLTHCTDQIFGNHRR